ncbi:MAG: hypothetical protein F4X12_22020 [Acidobacteriia bacterium]|nr:hypothetical protein [Terriglobia bacterium]
MPNSQKIKFKDPIRIIAWLEAALEHEREKYQKAPVQPDSVPQYEMARAWGFVVAGYSLLEQSLKALMYMRKVQVPIKHSLTALFEQLGPSDQDQLREHYSDYRETATGMRQFKYESLDDFFKNLDGDSNRQGSDTVGSFDWRYFPIEEARSQTMPTVSIDFLHEITSACIQMVLRIQKGDSNASSFTHSQRMFDHRSVEIYRSWYGKRMTSEEWTELDDRVEILWGPDYKGRFDYQIFRGTESTRFFGIPPDVFDLPVMDMRMQVAKFTEEVRSRDASQRRLDAIAPQILNLLLRSRDPCHIPKDTVAKKWPLMYGFSQVVEESFKSDTTLELVSDVNSVLTGLTFLSAEVSQKLTQEKCLDEFERFLRDSPIAQKLLLSE